MNNKRPYLVAALIALLLLHLPLFAQEPKREQVLQSAEEIFAKYKEAAGDSSPGCAIGVSHRGEKIFEKAFGLAELEHGIPNTPTTIFESGSVAKQFTTAAVILLAIDGKLSLDDPARKYIPELPDYGSPLTIRHLMTHTAGLRDWGSVMALTGVGRGNRVVSQEVALDVVYRQKSLDFEPGDEYSYSNSGYNLLAEIVERVSGKSFASFTKERIFEPLGMKNSSWRTDYQKLVSGRAQAYSPNGKDGWRLEMPIMNVYGNGGMLTTVGDWLIWNGSLDTNALGAEFVRNLQTQAVLNDGRTIPYALGIVVGEYNGAKEIGHGGSTAGYQTYLARYPELNVAIAAMCNRTNGNPRGITREIVDRFVPKPPPPPLPKSVDLGEDELKKYVGIWRHEKTHFPTRTKFENGSLWLNSSKLYPQGNNEFIAATRRIKFTESKDGKFVTLETDDDGAKTKYYAETPWNPGEAEMKEFVGTWFSPEAEATVSIVLENGKLYVTQRPSLRLPLTPMYKDHLFINGFNGMTWITREGKKTTLHVGGSRLRDIEFERR